MRPGGSARTRNLRVFTLGTGEHALGTFECVHSVVSSVLEAVWAGVGTHPA